MQLSANHLSLSRHGIWYYRWVVPPTVRARFPRLPRELKRSTRSADIRVARVIAQSMHMAVLRGVASAMNTPFDPSLIRQFEIEFDKDTGRLKRFRAEPSEMGDALHAAQQLFRLMNEHIDASVTKNPSGLGTMAATPAIARTSAVLMAEAFGRYAADRLASKNRTQLTYQRAHKPSIDLFRELVGMPTTEGDATTTVDLPLNELTLDRLETALADLRRFPDRQGRRDDDASVRELLARELPPQSLANFNKRLAHIRQFVEYCVNKGWIDQAVLRRIVEVLSLDTRHARKRDALQRGDIRAVVDDGYVAFTHDELATLFGTAFDKHVKGLAYRYWTPLIAAYTGMRVSEVSQLAPHDFELIDGIRCVRVRPDMAAAGNANERLRRVKTVSSIRVIPIHPKLVELGLWDFADRRRAAGHTLMWDGLLHTEKDGYGKYPSRDFKLLSEATGVYVKRRKVFHSFRSTIAQALEQAGLDGTLIDRFLGHDVGTTRVQNYNRRDGGAAFPVQRVYESLAKVSFPINPPPWSGMGKGQGRRLLPRRPTRNSLRTRACSLC